jgi:hypothetical protein
MQAQLHRMDARDNPRIKSGDGRDGERAPYFFAALNGSLTIGMVSNSTL